MRSLLVPLVLAVLARAAGADCPTNSMTVNTGSRTSVAPRDSMLDTYYNCPEPYSCCYRQGWAGYDLVAGTAYAGGGGSGHCTGLGEAATHDVFTLIGPPSAPSITFLAQARVTTFACGDGDSRGTLREGAANSVTASSVLCSYDTVDIHVAITRAPGTTFDLYLVAFGQGGDFFSGGRADAELSLSFPDLPAGYSVVSCQGFTSGQPVPVRRTTWGHVRATYR